MTFFEYGKRRYVPGCCPKCGQKAIPPDGTVGGVLKSYYVGWNTVLRKNHWRIWRWFGRCGNCMFNELIFSPDPFLARLKKVRA